MKAMLIHNPRAGQRDRAANMAWVESRLRGAGWELHVCACESLDRTEEAARQAVASGFETLVVAGGDGSLNAAIQSLAHQSAALGVLPVGTANVWAREMGIPLNIRAATEVMLGGQVARVDLGRANHRYFLFVASVGFDAGVTREVTPWAKRRLGMAAYIFAGMAEAFKLRGTEAVIITDNKMHRQRLLMLVANNIRLYGGLIQMTPEAMADDGLLDLCVFRGHGTLAVARHVANVLLRRHTRDPEADCLLISRVSVDARKPLPVQLDGDYFGTTPVTIRAVPGALRAIVPRGYHPQLRAETAAARVP